MGNLPSQCKAGERTDYNRKSRLESLKKFTSVKTWRSSMAVPTQQPTQEPRTPDPSSAPKVADEHFAHLHKMSTTAGLGSGDYVAVNIPAVVAILLGIASSLCLLDPIFLVIPLAGLICSIMSLMQIRRSGGTQTGTLLAIGGLVLALLFSGIVGYRQLNEYLTNSRESAAVVAVIKQFEDDAKTNNWSHAYTLMDPKFKEKITEEQFVAMWKQFESSPIYGPISAVVWNGNLDAYTDTVTGGRYARALVRFHYAKSAETQTVHEMVFHLVNGTWKITQISSFFGTGQYG
jgi:hypothetical protein